MLKFFRMCDKLLKFLQHYGRITWPVGPCWPAASSFCNILETKRRTDIYRSAGASNVAHNFFPHLLFTTITFPVCIFNFLVLVSQRPCWPGLRRDQTSFSSFIHNNHRKAMPWTPSDYIVHIVPYSTRNISTKKRKPFESKNWKLFKSVIAFKGK